MITYLKGDVRSPIKKPAMICHCCNDVGKMGSGVALDLLTKWPTVRITYLDWYNHKDKEQNEHKKFALGNIDTVNVETDICVVNMIGQHLVGKDENGGPCIRYHALESCLKKVSALAIVTNRSIHLPLLGSGLAGGKWEIIEKIIEKTLNDNEVFIYTL